MEKRDLMYLRLVRVTAAMAIVILHTFNFFAASVETLQLQRVVSYCVRNMQMFAVPCFVMVSGVLLLNPEKELTVRYIVTKYVLRVGLALLFFSLFYYVYDHVIQGMPFSGKDIWAYLLQVYQNKSWSHMWYLYLILGIYLLLPLFRLAAKHASASEYRYFLVLFFAFLSVLATADFLFGIKTGFYICVYSVYPLYLFLGDALHRKIIVIPKWIAVLLFLLGLIGIPCITCLQFSLQADALGKLVSNYASVLVVLFSLGAFLLLKDSRINRESAWGKLISLTDKTTFGVYLIHMLFIRLYIDLIRWNPFSLGVVPGCLVVLLMALAFFVLSALLTYLLKKIPGIKIIL